MKIRTSNKASRQISPAKGLLPIVATAAIAGGVEAVFGGEVLAAPVEVVYSGKVYTLDISTCFAPGSTLRRCDGATDFRQSSWFGDEELSKNLSKATKDLLGLPNPATITSLGPYFVWKSETSPPFNSSTLTFEAFAWDPILDQVFGRIGSWNSLIGDGSGNAYWLAKEVAPARTIPIIAANNGTSINTSASLANGTLFPQFQGGTLSVSSSATSVSSAFTLNSSAANAIDAAGNNATFSGVFSDQTGSKGEIKFLNSSSPFSAIRLDAQSTYTGETRILNNLALEVGVQNALPVTTELLVGGGTTSSTPAILRLVNVNQEIATLGGRGNVELGSGTLTINSPAQAGKIFYGAINGSGGLVKNGAGEQIMEGALDYSGPTEVRAGVLRIDGSSKSDTFVESGGTLGGTGVISANVFNFGTVSPGKSIGTLTINGGSYLQDAGATLAIEVAGGGQSDLLQLTGTGTSQAILLEGSLKLSSYKGASITPGIVYTAVSVPAGTVGGDPGLNADTGGVAGTGGYTFVRDEDPGFAKLQGGNAKPDPNKLQFGWIQLQNDPNKNKPSLINPNANQPGTATINATKESGGALTLASSGPKDVVKSQCVSNTGNSSVCADAVGSKPPTGKDAANSNSTAVAKTIDAGISSVHAAVNQGVTGGTSIRNPGGGQSGYTTNQTKAAQVTPDFLSVYSALYGIPTRSELNQALHSITAEPYASMQSVALEAMEQFRSNALALSEGNQAIRLFTEAEMCQLADGTLIPAETTQRPSDCKPRKISQASRWSLLIDATNTQASLEGTNDLASLDYNIFQSTYGLQYDASRQWSLGGAFGYGQANLYNYEYANSTIDSNTYGGGIWAIYRPGDAWKITGLLGYMNLQYDSSRQIDFGGLNRTARANWSGNGFTSALEVQYDWILSANKADRNAVRIKPNTYLSYSLHSQGDITESGADALNLAIDGHTADSLVYGIGFTLETPLQLAASTRLIPRLSVGYEYDFNGDSNEEHQLSASFADVPALGSLDVLGQNRGANDLNVGLSVELETSDQLSLYAGVGGSFWSNGNELNYGGGVRWRFGGAPKATMAKAQAPAAPASEPSAAPAVEQPAPSIRGLW